jgi:hypothetical protein
VGVVRAIDLAVFADALAGEAAAVAARAERARARLRQGAIEREARVALAPAAVARLQARGLLRPLDPGGLREELAELDGDLAAVLQLQSWVEARLAEAQDDYPAPLPSRGERATRRPPSSS